MNINKNKTNGPVPMNINNNNGPVPMNINKKPRKKKVPKRSGRVVYVRAHTRILKK
jgi:hypothetical protein